MPYIKTLENREVANTPSAIFREMAALLELGRTQYKISFKQLGGDAVGVDLPVRSNEGRGRKKRWWEVKQHPNQLNLSFPLYQPATILGLHFAPHWREMQITVQYTDDDDNQKRLLCCNDGSGDDSRTNVIALQLHKIVSTFIPDATDHDVRQGLTILTVREAANLLSNAVEHGLDIQTDGIAVDRVTGDVVGADFRILPSDGILNNVCEPLIACRMRLRDGEKMTFYIERRRLRQLRPGRPTEEACVRLLTQAIRRGLVITSTGHVYDKVTGVLIGTDARLDPPRVLREGERNSMGLLPPISVSGDVRLLSGQTRCFWIEAGLLDCRVSESYVAPTQRTCYVRGTQSSRVTAGGSE